jgi:plasmid maintenance system antidote protein VapI
MVVGALMLRSHLREHGITHNAFARDLDVSERYLFLLLSGQRKVNERQAKKIEALTGIPVNTWSIARAYTKAS